MREIREKEIPITPIEATLFALGIYEETGSMSFTTTTEEDVRTVAWLISQGASLKIIQAFIHQSLTEEQRRLLNDLILSSKVYDMEGYEILITKAETAQYVDELALLSQRLMELQRVDGLFSLVKMRDRIYIVARSREYSIDVNEILAVMGGGGHSTAASVSIRKRTLEEVEQELLNILRTTLKPSLVAGDLMTSPVQTIDAQTTIDQAYVELIRYGHSGLPVLEGSVPAGMITRKVVDKAIHHGFGNAPVAAYMSKPVITVSRNSTMTEIRKKFIEEDIGRLLIVEENRLMGIITRTDLLKNLHGDELIPAPRTYRRTLDFIRNLPDFIQSILQTAGAVADEQRISLYVVGGFVRDLLLGVKNLDIDLVVEGNSMEYAKALSARLKGRVRFHEKFHTAILILPDGFKIDIAAARAEYYTRPAALPEVADSSLKQDLYRRDFSINALAIKLNTKDFGQLVDFFGSLRDLRSGIVRVLHNLSFIDDPTRIFRAIKFEQRYHFRMDQHTESLLRAAVSMDIFHEVSADRIRDEIIQILEEERPLPALKRMEQLRILRIIHPRLILDTRVTRLLEDIGSTISEYREFIHHEKLDRWIIYFMGLVSCLSEEAIGEIGQKYKVTALQLKKLTFAKGEFTELVKTLSVPHVSKSSLHEVLESISMEGLLYIMARTRMQRVRRRIDEYLSELYRYEPLVSGVDLIQWGYEPGPFFREALGEIRRAQLDDVIKTREEARQFLERTFPDQIRNYAL
jgi:tRNA nucleotidyltransferase (CCA-adding enzyme)